MCRFILLSVCILILSLSVKANYVRITRDLSIADQEIYDTHVNVNFSIAWDNSWRDDFNWDAVYIFLKCRRKNEVVWQHVCLRPDYHRVSNGYEYMLASNGTKEWMPGLFIFRNRNGSGDAAVDLTLQWDYKRNGYSKSDFSLRQLDYTAMCIEMVYVPNGSFYVGDNYSNNTFKAAYQPIWEKYDLVKIDGKNSFNSDLLPPRIGRLANPPEKAANHVNMNVSGNSRENAWVSGRSDSLGFWQISFPEEKTVRYFGISGVSGGPVPQQFKLFGKRKNDATWTGPLFTGTSADWLNGPADSYPVSKSLKVEHPGSYTDYMIRFYGAAVAINNISMTDKDLSNSTDFAYLVDNYKSAVTLSNSGRGMYADDASTWSGSLGTGYPTGFYGFYVMKYEISQDQYVRFLNKLSLDQQKARTIGDDLLNVPKGGYVFGDSHTQPEARNGIVVATPAEDGRSVVFAHNLTDGGEGYSQPDDGMTVACNFLNPYDMLAYADWTGLRPMSEMEFEKAARAAYPETPARGEWAWNSGELTTLKTEGTLENPGQASERWKGANVNTKEGKLGGPVRCGSFAAANGSRVEAGASYWGVMELSGNLAEICYNANPEGRGFQQEEKSHGDGTLAANGNTNVSTSYWPVSTEAFALRGGSWNHDSEMAMVSDRTKAWTGYQDLKNRHPEVSFRLAHSVGSIDNTTLVTYLTLQNGQNTMTGNLDTVCAGEIYTIKGSDLLSSSSTSTNGGRKDVKKEYRGRCEYIWYFSENGGATWNVIPEARDRDLIYDHFANDGSSNHEVWVRRLMITPEYASMSGTARVTVVNTAYEQYRMRDTIRLNNAVLGCLIETSAPAQYTWRWKGQVADPVRVSGRNVRSDFYAADRDHFNGLSGMSFPVECEIKIQKCTIKTEVEIYVMPRNEKKVIASNEVKINSDDPTRRCGVLMMNPLDGEVYTTVKIGSQCWMAENVRTAVPGYSYIQTGDGNPKVRMGMFYARHADVINTVCPSGWEMPSKADFDALKTYLDSDGTNTSGVKLKAGNYWNVTGSNLVYQGDNSTGFGAFGVGYYQNNYMGTYVFFGTSDGYEWYLSPDRADFVYNGGWSRILSIRCIRKLDN